MSKVREVIELALTVAEVIEELKQYDPGARVVFTCDYGDIGHTQQALPVSNVSELGDLGPERLVEGPYSRTGIIVEESIDDEWFDEEDEGDTNIIILR